MDNTAARIAREQPALAGSVLVLSRFRSERVARLQAIAAHEGLTLVNFDDVLPALEWIEREKPVLVLFDTRVPRCEAMCVSVRSRRELSAVPLIALSADSSDGATARLYALGADDVIPITNFASIASRLRLSPKGPPAVNNVQRGCAVIADRDPGRCDVIGRVLTNAGFDVRYALDERAMAFYAVEQRAKLIVAGSELLELPRSIQDLRKSLPEVAWVITAPRRTLSAAARSISGIEGVAVTGAHMPPEDVLFMSNQLLARGNEHERESVRILFGTTVWFRSPGADEDEIGLTYNISAAGLYVRTLVPPAGDDVWLELRPPRSRRRVRLEGKIIWRRSFGFSELATTPAGFGVQITGALGDGLEAWQQAYRAFSADNQRHIGGGLAELLADTLQEAKAQAGAPEAEEAPTSERRPVQLSGAHAAPVAAPAPEPSAVAALPGPAPARRFWPVVLLVLALMLLATVVWVLFLP